MFTIVADAEVPNVSKNKAHSLGPLANNDDYGIFFGVMYSIG